MSTKAIREALTICLMHGRADGSAQAVNAAEAAEKEVEAIERAAKFYAACPAVIRPKELREDDGAAAHETVCSIAKDAP